VDGASGGTIRPGSQTRRAAACGFDRRRINLALVSAPDRAPEIDVRAVGKCSRRGADGTSDERTRGWISAGDSAAHGSDTGADGATAQGAIPGCVAASTQREERNRHCGCKGDTSGIHRGHSSCFMAQSPNLSCLLDGLTFSGGIPLHPATQGEIIRPTAC
jgi:hypothetical protein